MRIQSCLRKHLQEIYTKKYVILLSNMWACVPQPCGDAVTLLENVALISEGTTGLVTWEAALYLAEWALDHQQTFNGRYQPIKPLYVLKF